MPHTAWHTEAAGYILNTFNGTMWWRLGGFAALLTAGAGVLWGLESLGAWEPGRLAAFGERLGPAAPLFLMAVMALAVVVAPLPTFPVSAAAGALFGPWFGTLYAVLGALAGAVAAYWIARLLGRDLVARRLGGHVALCPQCSNRLLFSVVFAARLVPVVSFALVSYAGGLTAMTTAAFALATTLGMLPMTLVYVGLGASLQLGAGWLIASGLAAVAFLFALPVLVERYNFLGLRAWLPAHGSRPGATKSDRYGE
jgi:uncharacterized membrane protein YdjX (TVP38/TMEM64 family)